MSGEWKRLVGGWIDLYLLFFFFLFFGFVDREGKEINFPTRR